MIYKIKDLTFSYERGKSLFEKLSLDIPSDKIIIVKGNNGSGKTTLCSILTGLINDYKGSIEFKGRGLGALSVVDISREVIHIRQNPVGNSVGINLDEDLSIRQNKFQEDDDDEKKRARIRALEIFSLQDIAFLPVWKLSNGQRKAGMLAALCLFRDRYWILDEPTNSLDKEKIKALTGLIKEKKGQGTGALITTHTPELFTDIGDLFFSLDEENVQRDFSD